MKAITLWQPWATLVAIGAKQYETRSWSTDYRGRLAIHAAKRQPEGFSAAADVLGEHGVRKWSELPRGAVVAVARLVDVHSTTFNDDFVERLSKQERAFGDFRSGRYAWELVDAVELPAPIPARGFQGLWEWTPPAEVLALLKHGPTAEDFAAWERNREANRQAMLGIPYPTPEESYRAMLEEEE